MSNVTLILTRQPLQEFNQGRKSGRWGSLAVVTGAKISSAGFSGPDDLYSGIDLNGRMLNIRTEGSEGLDLVAEYDTMERFRADSGGGFYMQVRPRPNQPYRLTMYRAGLVAKLNGSGNCLLVHGHGYRQQGTGNTAGILIHEAPHIGWLIGCISPREQNNRTQTASNMPSRNAMETIFAAMGGFSIGTQADLFVLDW
jgi:hypothetical protein